MFVCMYVVTWCLPTPAVPESSKAPNGCSRTLRATAGAGHCLDCPTGREKRRPSNYHAELRRGRSAEGPILRCKALGGGDRLGLLGSYAALVTLVTLVTLGHFRQYNPICQNFATPNPITNDHQKSTNNQTIPASDRFWPRAQFAPISKSGPIIKRN